MYNLIKTFRLGIIISFFLIIFFLFAKFLLLPITMFILIIKLLGYFKFKKITKNKTKKTNKKHHDKSFIDAEYEEVD